MNSILKIFSILFIVITSFSCLPINRVESSKLDFTTTGPLGDDIFQVIITRPPDKDSKTMTAKRESAYIDAKKSIPEETKKQILNYYLTKKGIKIKDIPEEKLVLLNNKFGIYAESGKIEQEYYLMDNSAVLVFRIYKNEIKKGILEN